MQPGSLGFRRAGHFCLSKRGGRGAGQVGLIFVEGEEFVRSGLASDGDVEEIHGTSGQVAGVNGAEFVS